MWEREFLSPALITNKTFDPSRKDNTRHHETQLMVPLKPRGQSQHYRIKGLKGGHLIGTHS